MSYLPGTSYYIELEHIINNINYNDRGEYKGKRKFGRKKHHKLLKQKIIEFNKDNGENIFITFPRFSKLLVEAFDNNSLNNTQILLEFGADLNYGDQTIIFNNIVNSMIDKISALINKNNKYLSIVNDLKIILNNLMILPDDNNYDEMDELIELLDRNDYDNLIEEIIDVSFEDSNFEIELERISKILLYGNYSRYSAPYGLSYSLSINELLNLYYKFFKIYLNYDIDYDKGENNFEFITGDNEMNEETNVQKAIQLVLLELDKAKFNLIKGKQMLEFSKISQMTNTPYKSFPIDLLEKIGNINTPIYKSVMQKVKENENIANYLNTLDQYGSGKRKKKKTRKRKY